MLEDRTPGSTEYPDSVFLTWATTIGKLPAGARAVLRLCSFLAPAPVPVDLLVKGAAQIEAQAAAMGMAQAGPATEFEVREWKRDLARYSMIQLTSGDAFSIHSLVQLVERHQVPPVQRSGMVEKAVELVMAWAPLPANEYQSWQDAAIGRTSIRTRARNARNPRGMGWTGCTTGAPVQPRLMPPLPKSLKPACWRPLDD